MFNFYQYLKKIVFLTPPEVAHKMGLQALKYNFLFDYSVHEYYKPYLSQNIFNLSFDSPVGLSAGFDKNAELIGYIHKCGFGFAECGTVTPFAQEGNSKPRVFRIEEEEALINALGFNNEGIEKFLENALRSYNKKIPIGANIGPNKNSEDFMQDYLMLLEKIYERLYMFDYVTINISSPNTANLRSLHEKEALEELLGKITQKNQQLADVKSIKLPIFLKISPDVQHEDLLENIIPIALNFNIDALIISNTTVDKSMLPSKYQKYSGGLSGKPLMNKSTELLRLAYPLVKNTSTKLIGVGGISSAQDVYTKIKAGASLVQLYTAMIYHGPFIANQINRDLIGLLQSDGFDNISQAVGIENGN